MGRRRILLKLSGESLCEPAGFGLDADTVGKVSCQLRSGLAGGDLELAIVLGGGNFLRGRQLLEEGIDRATGDSMGMLATVINALALRSSLQKEGVEARVVCAFECGDIAERFERGRCLEHLQQGRVLLLAGGTGHPYFTTDTTAALRGLELEADLILKGTKVKGVYSADPEKDPKAEFYERLSFLDCLQKRLQVMDAAAISLCMDNDLPILVFNIREPGNLERVLRGEEVGTLVR